MPISNRRDFLQGSVVVAGVLGGRAALGVDNTSTDPANRKSTQSLRFAVLGGSTEAAEMLRGLAGRHAGIVSHFWNDSSSRPAKLLAKVGRAQKQAIRIESDPGKILNDPTIDAVAIAAPVPDRTQLATAALEAGKDVLLAVPFATGDEDHRLAELAADHNNICAVHLPWRNNVGLRQAMHYLHSGKIGEVCRVHALAVGHPDCARLVFPIDLALWACPSLRSFQFTGQRWCEPGDQNLRATVGMFTGNGPSILLETRPSGGPWDGVRVGVVVHTTRGKLLCPGADSAVAFGPNGEVLRVFQGTGDPYAGFVRAVRTRDARQLATSLAEADRTGNAWSLVGRNDPMPLTSPSESLAAASARVLRSLGLTEPTA